MLNNKKVISNQEQVENALISRDLLWPCLMYRVDIQSSENQDLNAFEIFILRLAAQSYTDVERIHEISYLDKDLIRFIQDRLQQLKLLSSNKLLSNDGKQQLERLMNRQSSSDKTLSSIQSTVPGYIFVDKVTGKLLPIVTKDIVFETVIELGKGKNILRFGDAGTSHDIQTRTIRPPKNVRIGQPQVHEVRHAMMEMKKQLKQKAFLGGGNDLRFKASSLGLEIALTSEDVYLHTKVFLPQGAEDFIVTDGFSTGFNSSFGYSLKELEAEWLLSLRERALKTKPIDKNRDQSLFDKGIKKLYPSLGRVIELAEAAYHSYHLTGYSDPKELRTCVLKLYEAMEQVFLLLWQQNQTNDWQAYLHTSKVEELQNILTQLCERSRFKQNKKTQAFFKFNASRLKRAASGEVLTLPALFALNLISAQRHLDHPLSQLQHQYADCLLQLSLLKQNRDNAAHGKEIELGFTELSSLRNNLYCYIALLIPTTADYLPQESLRHFVVPYVEQSKLKATIVFEKMFDLYQRQQISIDLKNQIIQMEQACPEFQQEQTIDANRWILEIASLIQQLLYQLMPTEAQAEPQELKKLVYQKLTQAGFIFAQEQLPVSLTQVDINKVKAAFHHIETTLGAQLLAFVIKIEPLTLHHLAQNEPELILFIDHVLQLRGHGNQECKLNQEQVHDIKTKTYQLINLLLQA